MLFPETCLFCQGLAKDHSIAPICLHCWQTVSAYEGPVCQRCGQPLVSDSSMTCRECLQDEPAFAFARSFGLYEGALKKAINLLKYHNVKRLSKPLSDIISPFKIPAVDAVIPVPLYKKRLRQKEYNQSASLQNMWRKVWGSRSYSKVSSRSEMPFHR